MGDSVTIRVWNGCTVVGVCTYSPTGGSHIGAVGGASNSTRVDIEIDPWAHLVVDHRVEYARPVSTREDDDG